MTFVAVFILSAFFVSCSSDGNTSLESNTEECKIEALAAFDRAFDNSFDYLVSTRSVIVNADGNITDSLIAIVGRELCKSMGNSVDDILNKFGITDQILQEEYRQNLSNANGETNFVEFKCFVALTIYDTYIVDKTQEPILRGVDALDVVSCIGLGVTTKQLLDYPARKIAQFAAAKLSSRLVPYVGWGWGVASAAYCLSRL